MPEVSFQELMTQAEQGHYAVGYFESWNQESLLAVADAAEATRSPVILGFSGMYLSHPQRVATDGLSHYAALGRDVCRNLNVPACLLFNESPHVSEVLEAIELGFGLVMYADEDLAFDLHLERVCEVVASARSTSTAVEAEIAPPPGLNQETTTAPEQPHLTDPSQAADFLERTGVDALSVNIGQAHLHGRAQVRLNLDHLTKLKKALDIPLVLHAASSVAPADLAEAARLGIRKINVGSNLKRTYFETLRQACGQVAEDYNPYEVVGSGLPSDVAAVARVALQKAVEDQMRLFGSAGKV